jgi:hypothetical protein
MTTAIRFPVGAVVVVPHPAVVPAHPRQHFNLTAGLVFEAYRERGRNMYSVLLPGRAHLRDMKAARASTSALPAAVCCQQMDEDCLMPLHLGYYPK